MENDLFDISDTGVLLKYQGDKLGEEVNVHLPDSVSVIGYRAFVC